MSHKPAANFEQASCGNKRRWRNEREAKMSAGLTHGRFAGTTEGRRYVYRCSICDGWHVTSNKGTAEQRAFWRAEARRLAAESPPEPDHSLDGYFAAQRKAGRR